MLHDYTQCCGLYAALHGTPRFSRVYTALLTRARPRLCTSHQTDTRVRNVSESDTGPLSQALSHWPSLTGPLSLAQAFSHCPGLLPQALSHRPSLTGPLSLALSHRPSLTGPLSQCFLSSFCLVFDVFRSSPSTEEKKHFKVQKTTMSEPKNSILSSYDKRGEDTH